MKRSTKQRLALATVLAALSVAVLPVSVAGAASRAVTNCNDSGPGSLRDAVGSAATGDTVTFSVSCPPGTPITLTNGPIDITTSLTIAGSGAATVAVSGNNSSQVFTVEAGVGVTISGITIEDGAALSGCSAGCSSSGGGIENFGALTVNNSVLSANNANNGCTAFCGASGGGIENDGSLTVDHSTLTGNGANGTCGGFCSGSGGGIENNGTMTVINSTVSANSANSGCLFNCGASGGGIENSGTGKIIDSTVSANTAGLGCAFGCGSSGGGIDNAGTLTVINTTVANNSADIGCDGNCVAEGGGIANDSSGTLTLTNSTLSANSVSAGCGSGCSALGGGFFNAGTANVGATIVANSATSGGDCSLAAPLNDLGYNLDDDGTCFSGPTDLSNTPSGLDTAGLQDNGGPTYTIALDAGSAAIDKVAAALCPATDQRGSGRIPPCDIGAYDTDGNAIEGSQVHAVIQIETSPSYAGDPVHIDSSQLQAACGGNIDFETLQGGSTLFPRTSFNSITAILDDDGNVTVVVDGAPCASGSDVIEADLTVAPFLTATTIVNVQPPQVTAEGVSAAPANEVETGNSPASGASDVYTVFTVETNPVYAEQPVEISSPQLESRCGEGWRWEPGTGTTINQDSGTTVASGILDDDGNATFVFKGRSCAAGASAVIADVEAGSHPTYVTTYTVLPPAVTLASTMAGPSATTKKAGAHPSTRHHRHHNPGTTPPVVPPAMTVNASPNPLVETGVPLASTMSGAITGDGQAP
ncbi:MAG TPA: choice-of-anchor Q domain-containing protein [Acidimicrobiales bacterium]